MRRGVKIVIALLAGLTVAGPVLAQAQRPPAATTRPLAPTAPAKEPAPSPEPPPPPYEPQLLKLAEIIGSLSYLRTLCAAREAQDWRDRMTALIEAEGRTSQRRERLTSAYNRGFRAYAATHRLCTDGSQEASARLAGEGERLASTLAGRYGG